MDNIFSKYQVSDFFMVFIGLILAAIPFVVFGVVVSIALSRLIKPSFILKYKSKNRIISHIQVMFIGMLIPVCECGNVPLAKRLSVMGLTPSEVMTFMLSAPIFNPIVLVTTLVAFSLDPNVAIIRVLAGAFVAMFVGMFFSIHPNQKALLSNNDQILSKTFTFSQESSSYTNEVCQNEPGFFGLVNSFRDEFFTVFKMLLIGCAIASVFQVLIPRDVFNTFSSSPTLAIISLMLLAFVISICSSVDSFFALSLANIFNLGAIISFLIFGPLIDIKSLIMLKTVFKPKTLVIMTCLVTLLCFIIGLLVNYLYKTQYI